MHIAKFPLFILGCSVSLLISPVYAKSQCGDDLRFIPFAKHKIVFHNLIASESVKKGQALEPSSSLGQIRKIPKPFTPNDELFAQGEEAYARRDFEGSIELFTRLYAMDKENPFVLNALGRSFYWMKGRKKEAIGFYLQLMKILEKGYLDSEKNAVVFQATNAKSRAITVIDPWFIDAYWKLGTLYLDYEKYPEAIFEMHRLYYYEYTAEREIPAENIQLAVQLFRYLTEAYYFVKDKEANQYFYCRIKEIDPQDTYVDRFQLK